MVEKKGFAEAKAYTIFNYSLGHLKQSDKVRFYYALKGRDGESGIVHEWDITQLGRGVLMVPDDHSKAMHDFLQQWGCEYEARDSLVMPPKTNKEVTKT